MEGHFKKQKVHLFFSFFHPFLPSKYHGKKIKIKNYADALCWVMPSLGYCSQNKCPSTLKRPLFQECPAHQALPYTYWGNALTLELYPILNLFHLGIYSGGGCSWATYPTKLHWALTKWRLFSPRSDDETVSIFLKTKALQKGGIQETKWKDLHPRRQKNHLKKKVNHKGNIKFPNPLLSWEAYQIRKGEDLLKGHLALKNAHILKCEEECSSLHQCGCWFSYTSWSDLNLGRDLKY